MLDASLGPRSPRGGLYRLEGPGLLASRAGKHSGIAMNTVQTNNASPGENLNGTRLLPLLRRAQLSKFLNDAQLKDLESYCRSISRSAGQTLFRQGEEPTTLYIVMEGAIELRARPPGRRVYRTVEVVGPGCTAGDEAVLGESGYLSSARVQEKARLLALGTKEFDRLAATRPDMAIGILRCAGSCLIQTIRRAAILTQAPADVALGLLLGELSAEADDDGDGDGAVRITHAQLAGLLHLSRETVSRMLGHMAARGDVELSRGVIRVRSL
jgi:CRP/FNR family transcriptional regulator, cyclic AMP receptor protein